MKLENSSKEPLITFKTFGATGLFIILGALALTSEGSKQGSKDSPVKSDMSALAASLGYEKTSKNEKLFDFDREFVNLLKGTKPGSVLVVTTQGKVRNSETIKGYLKSSGSKLENSQVTGPYLALVSENGKVIFEKNDPKETSISVDLLKEPSLKKLFSNKDEIKSFEISSSTDGLSEIKINKANYSKSQKGWNVLELGPSFEPKTAFIADTLTSDQLRSFSVLKEEILFSSLNKNKVRDEVKLQTAPLKINLKIKEKFLDKIKLKRKEAIERTILFSSKDDFVPAKIVSGDTEKKVSIRLKGDWVDHLLGERWSFRVNLKGDNTFEGMKTFSLQDPITRGYLYTWMFHKAWDKLGGISLRYKFVNFSINDEELGTMALAEHFEKRAVEFNQRREGPILKYDETSLWQQFDVFGSPYGLAGFTSPLDSFNSKKTLERESLRKNFIHAANLLDKFRSGKLQAKEVFDIDLMSKYIALADFFGSYHSINWHNLRFYYNPISSRIEPISFDPRGTKIAKRIAYVAHGKSFQAYLFKDEEFTKGYFKALRDITEDEFFIELLENNYSSIQENIELIRKNKPNYSANFQEYVDRGKEIKNILALEDIAAPYFSKLEGEDLSLKVSILHPLPIEVMAVSHNGKDFEIASNNKTILPQLGHDTSYQSLDFKVPGLRGFSEKDSLSLKYRILGLDDEIKETFIKDYPYSGSSPLDSSLFKEDDYYKNLDFIKISEEHKTISFAPGNWEIEKTITIPKGYSFQIFPGTKIKLLGKAAIFSSSPLSFIGSEESPIHISGGQGLFLNKAKGKDGIQKTSILKNVLFSGLSNFSSVATSHTGAVTIHKSPVEIEKCLFQNNISEDALNIVSSKFSIDKVVFENIDRDALDVDFGNGKISNSTFINVGNDALDFSGSKASIDNVSVHDCSDKALSSGEKSEVSGQNFKVNNCQVGIASKDFSKVNIANVDIHNSKILLTAYAKKPEFGPASISLKNLTFSGETSKKFLIEKDSSLELDGKLVEVKRNKKESTILNALKKGVFQG